MISKKEFQEKYDLYDLTIQTVDENTLIAEITLFYLNEDNKKTSKENVVLASYNADEGTGNSNLEKLQEKFSISNDDLVSYIKIVDLFMTLSHHYFHPTIEIIVEKEDKKDTYLIDLKNKEKYWIISIIYNYDVLSSTAVKVIKKDKIKRKDCTFTDGGEMIDKNLYQFINSTVLPLISMIETE